MARGGMYDQLGGGFARYSVDAGWVVPHFEKMLYDNALLVRVYAHLWRRTGDGAGPAGGRGDLRLDPARAADRRGRARRRRWTRTARVDEGKFYVWTPDELREVLGPTDARVRGGAFGVTEAGTFEHGASVLQLRGP